MTFRVLVPVLCVWAAAAGAQEAGGVGGAVAGFVYESGARALCPVLGVPGAAYLGRPVLAEVEAASVAPNGSAALAVKAGRLHLAAGLRGGRPEVAAIEGAIEGADRFAWSPDGATAAVCRSKARRAQIVSNLAGKPRAGAPIDLPGDAVALAVAGEMLLAGVAGENGGVYLLTAGGGARRLATAARPAAMTIAGRDLYFADRERGHVWQVRDFSGQATPLLFAEGLREPVGLQVAGKRLFVANAGDRTVEVYDLDARASIAALTLNAAPEGLEAFGGRSLWLLNAVPAAGDPFYVLDGGAESPAIYFIPAGTSGSPARTRPRPVPSPHPGGSRR